MTLRKKFESWFEAGRHDKGSQRLGDFTTTWQVIPITLLATVIGIFSAFVALALLRLIGLFTNLFFFQRVSTALVSPAGNKLGWLELFVPMIGGLVIGFMARYGSERIRGHGIPEAIEAISAEGWKGRTAGRIPQAVIVSDLHRLGRSVWSRRAHHHDRRRVRLNDCAVLPPHKYRAPHPIGRRCRCRHVRNICFAAGSGAAFR